MTDNLYKAPEAELTRKAMYLSKPRDLAICDVLFSFQGRLNRKQFWFRRWYFLNLFTFKKPVSAKTQAFYYTFSVL